MRRLLLLAILAVPLVGCGEKDDGLDTAAAPTTSTTNQPPTVEGFKKQKLPPLAGPGAQGGPPGGAAGSNF